MPNLQEFRIDFDRPGATYTPGETVTGKVVLNLSKSKNVREIRLEARGEAEVHWTKSRNVKDSSGRSHNHTDYYKSSEHYFSVSNRLVGSASGDGQTTLPAGLHSYHFTFQLPVNIPCSIEHKYGHVRYVVKAILDRPWRFDHKVVTAFTVIAPYDLNAQQGLSTGIHDEIKRRFLYCCFCNAGGMKVNVSSRVSGFVPGETIELMINYDNSSTRVDITKMKLKLVKNMTFHATSPFTDKKYDSDELKKVKKNGPFGKKGETLVKIEIPPLPPSNLEHCSIIDVSYQLALSIEISGMHFNVSRLYPVQLGTVPLYNHQTSNLSHNPVVAPYTPSAPPIDQITPSLHSMPQPPHNIGFVVMTAPGAAPPYSAQPLPEMPPPSYEECVHGSSMISDHNEQGMHGPSVQFAPKYPVYKFPMPMPYPP